MTPDVKQRIQQIGCGEVPEGYVKTALGLAPADWKRYTFGDIYTERKEPGSEELPLLMVSIRSGVSDGEVDEAELPKKIKRIEDKSQYKKAVSGDLVFNMMRAWQGAIGAVRTTGMVSPAYIVAEPNDKVYPLFMDCYTRTPQMINQINRQSYGVTDFRKRLYWDSFTPIGCILPSIAEQQKIFTILATQDKVIELKEKRLAQKQRQKKYLMQQLLTGKKRLPGFSKEWKSVRLRNTLNVCHGQNQHNVEQENGVYPILGTGGEIGRTNDFLYDKPSILIGRKGSINKPMYMETPFWTIDTLFYCKIKSGYHPKFLFFKFQSINWNKYDESSGVPSLNASTIGSVDIFVPEFPEQTAIAEVLSAADHEIDLLQQDIEQEKQKKKALMQLLLTGIVRVNV